MARRPRPKRRERRQRSNVLLRRLGLALVLALPVLYFAFTKLFFDPFESDQPPFSVLVPRDVGLYARRERLDSDLVELRPRVWDDLLSTRAWRELSQTEWWKSQTWPAEFEAQLAQIREASAQLPLDLVDDLAGREVAVLGRLPPQGEPSLAVMLRISGRAKLAVELLDYDAALERALPGATRSEVTDPEVPGLTWRRLDLPAGLAPGAEGAWFYARRLDLLVASRDETLVRDVLRQVQSGEQTSLGLSRMYQDELPPAAGEPDERLSLEFVLDTRPLLARLGLAKAEQPAATPQAQPVGPDALANVLDRLVDPSQLGEAAGRLELDERLSLQVSADLADPRASDLGTGLRGSPAFVLRDRLKSVLGLLPSDTTAVVTINAALRPLLEAVASSLGPDETKLLNDTIRDVSRRSAAAGWRVDSLPALIAWLDKSLGDEVSIAMRPVDHSVPAGSQPLPSLAFLFHVDDDPAFQAFIDAVVAGHAELGIDPRQMMQVAEGVGTRKWLGVSNLPMTEFSCIVLDRETAVIGTDDDFVREIVAVYTNQRSSAAARPEVRQLLDRLPPRALANVAAWGDGEALLRVVEPYADYVADTSTILDLGVVRTEKSRELLATPRWSQWRGKEAEMPPDQRKEFDAALDQAVEAVEKLRQDETVPKLAAEWRERRQWLRLLKGFACGLRFGEHDAQLNVVANTAMQR
jgi:hypothetical protein